MRVLFRTFGCKANQYDTERMRQELEALGATGVSTVQEAQLCVVNTCTVTNQADADARRFIRRVRRENPGVDVVVAGCSSALDPQTYRGMDGVLAVVEGHDPVEVARAATGGDPYTSCHPAGSGPSATPLIQLEPRASDGRPVSNPFGGDLLHRRKGATRGWLKVQDGCDRKCSFCATRLARGESRSRPKEQVVAEAKLLSVSHPELVITGIHIGHYGNDLGEDSSLSKLVEALLIEVPDVRFRLGSVEATEIDDHLLELLSGSGGSLAPHLHMPLQSGSDSILKSMRRWHTRDTYLHRALEIAERFQVLGLGADVITGFPGETDQDHDRTRALVEEVPFTYLHVFPFSPRSGTPAEGLPNPVPQRIAGERSRELRELALEKGRAYRRGRIGEAAAVILEGDGGWALTEDYLRVRTRFQGESGPEGVHGILRGTLQGSEEHLYIDLSHHSMN